MKLGNPIYPPKFSGSWREKLKLEDDWFFNFAQKHDIISFLVGDGLAYYCYEKPNILRPILFGDEYEVAHALIRGLNKTEVEEEIKRFNSRGWLKKI